MPLGRMARLGVLAILAVIAFEAADWLTQVT